MLRDGSVHFRRSGPRPRFPCSGRSDRPASESRELIRRVGAGVYLPMRFEHHALLVDEIRDPFRLRGVAAVAGPIGQADLAVFVAEQRKREVILRCELRVVFRCVEAASEDLSVFFPILVVEVPEPGTLGRSAGCARLRIEPENDFAAAVIFEADHFTGVRFHRERWCRSAFFDHRRPPLPDQLNCTVQ